ncbi:hypothetical protein Q8A72_09045 [Aeribacillus pallidus]|nr:hypothetical protein [Aeribacillus pallidus]
MGNADIQKILDKLWGAEILDTQVDLLNDIIKFKIKITDDKVVKFHEIAFIDVSSFYFVKDSEEFRFNFYDREKVDFLELTSIHYQNEPLGELHFCLPNEEEWSKQYHSKVNIIIEIWDSILLIETRKISLDGKIINIKKH